METATNTRPVSAADMKKLLEMASTRLGAPVDQLSVSDAVVTVKADPAKRVTYGELVGGRNSMSH